MHIISHSILGCRARPIYRLAAEPTLHAANIVERRSRMSTKSGSQATKPTATPPALTTPSGFGANATRDIAAALNGVLADVFALYLKTKNFHWHMSGPHFRDYHLLLDEQSDQIF